MDKSKFNYDAFFNASFELLCIANAEGYFEDINPRWSEVLGYTEKELKSKPFVEFVHPEDRENTALEAAKLQDGKHKTINFKNRYLSARGDYHWMQWNATLFDGLIYAAARDVTDFVEQNKYFIETQEAARIGYWRLDMETMTPFWSEVTHDIHEVPRGDKIDLENAINFYVPEVREEVKAFVEAGLKEGVPWDRELPFITAKNNRIWVRTIGKPIYSLGKITGLYGTFQDITKIKEVSINLEKAYKDLKIHQEKLIRNSRLAALGEMAGGIAHEINNPLAILSGNSLKMRKILESNGIENEDINRSLAVVEKTVERISGIITALKSFSREDKSITFTDANVDSIIEDSLFLCREKFKNHGVDITTDVEKGLVCECNPTQISQVVVNLLNNAFYAVNQTSEKKIWVSVKKITASNEIEIRVEDSGHGVPETVKEKVFEPFFTTKPIGEGTGMGLGISLGIAQVHGGLLTLDEESKKTSFVLKLPVKQPESRA